jgi:hypothetical protein
MQPTNRPNIETLVQLLVHQLARESRKSQTAPEEWTGSSFKIERIKEAREPNDQELRRAQDLPSTILAFRFDNKPVLVGDLSEATNRKGLFDLLRRYRNQALITRSWIGAEATSISLFLAGPLGSQEDPTWNDWALEIELDEKVCRKIVWLLPENPTEIDAAHFLDGTSLAQPWKHREEIGVERLDSLAELGIPEHWLDVFQDETLGTDDVVNRLIDVGEVRGIE